MAKSLLDETIERIGLMTPEAKAELTKTLEPILKRKWIPSPGPQTEAYFSKADILLYGGQAGGGKSALLLGLALTEHHRSLIMRRHYGDLSALTEELLKFHGSRNGFAAAPKPKLRTEDGRLIEFGATQYLGDEESWQGQAHDFIGFDEVVHFLEPQIRFLMGWNRSSKEGQRCRVVMASNPPVGSQGRWIIDFFAPWLDPAHPNPARQGELRWFVSDADGKDMEVDGPELIEVNGRQVKPHSRTFISASVSDNPFLAKTDYAAKLDALPEPLRSAMRDGDFMAAKVDANDQLIPTSWVMEAVKRWTAKPPPGIPMCGIGVDPAGGGADETIIARRHDSWFDTLVSMKGEETPNGQNIGGKVVSLRRDGAVVEIDMGGGYGNLPFKELQDNQIEVRAFKGSAASLARTANRLHGFINKRAEVWYKFREALDPTQPGGSSIMLPNDPQLIADLTTPLYEETARGIKVESKEDIKERLGRSPDRGDAVVMAWHVGSRMAQDGQTWIDARKKTGRAPTVNLGHSAKKKRR